MKECAGKGKEKQNEEEESRMDGQYSWKRTEEIQIDLADLLRQLCMQWKQILLCALAAAMLIGGYGYVKNKSTAQVQNVDAAQDIELTPEEEQSVQAAVQLYEEVTGLEQYLENSLLMRIDPYHKQKAYMLYSIEQADRRNVQKITESYLSFVLNGGAADALHKYSKKWDMDKSYLTEIMTAYQKVYSFPYQITVDDALEHNVQTESVFYVELAGLDEMMAESLADDMKAVLKEHSEKVKKQAGSHRLRLIAAESTAVIDSSLQAQQHDKRTQLTANYTNLKSMTDTFSDKQLALYRSESESADDNAEEQTEAEKLEESPVEKKVLFHVKYMILGFMGGIVLYSCVFSLIYLFRDTLKNVKELKDYYTFPFYGVIALNKNSRRKSARLKSAASDTQEDCSQVLSRIKLTCKKQGIVKFCMASDFTFHAREKECIESMTKQLEDFGIHTSVVENAGRGADLWDTLIEMENILMVYRMGETTHRMIDDAMRFYKENDISVMGAVAFE